MQHSRIGGVPVIGTCADVADIVARHGIEEVLITSGDLPGLEVRRLVEMGREHGFRVNVLPSYKQLLEGRVAVQPRPVAIEDLLGRESVELDLQPIRDWLTGRVVMVTGSAGSIGSEICRQLMRLRPAALVTVDRAETGQFYLQRELTELAAGCNSQVRMHTLLTDLTDRDRLNAVLRDSRPEIIFHAAAYKHVPLMESHCAEAVKNIVLATRNLVDLAEHHGTGALVMISTDKAVNPTSVMGGCKRLAEQYVQARSTVSGCRFVTVRFGNVLDSSGSVVPIFRQQIARGGPVTVTHRDITRYFMLIQEAAQRRHRSQNCRPAARRKTLRGALRSRRSAQANDASQDHGCRQRTPPVAGGNRRHQPPRVASQRTERGHSGRPSRDCPSLRDIRRRTASSGIKPDALRRLSSLTSAGYDYSMRRESYIAASNSRTAAVYSRRRAVPTPMRFNLPEP
jgi:dTDP-4-dehydrorhamnose reductase